MLQSFHARLVLHQAKQAIFQRSIAAAKGSGLLASRKLKVALATTPIFGKGAVKDTYNLLADGIRQLVRALAGLSGQSAEETAAAKEVADKYVSRNRRLEPDVLKRRLYALLARCGFSPDTIQRVLRLDTDGTS